MSVLRVVRVIVRDVLGAVELEIEPGQINTIQGKNGSGKSTALEAIQAALGGGNLGKLARIGKPGEKIEPEVVLLIEGPGTEAYQVKRKADKVHVRQRVRDTAAFEEVGKPQAWLRALYDPQGSNPVAFLTAKDDQRATLLLEALDLPYSRAELLQAMGLTADELPALPAEGLLHPLEELALIRKGVFSTRTGVNVSEAGKRTAAEEVRLNSPAVVPDAPEAAALDELEAAVVELAQQLTAEEERATATAQAAHAAWRTEYDREEARIASTFRREAAALRADHEAAAAETRAEAERKIATAAAAVEAKVEELRTAGDAELARADVKRTEGFNAANAAKEQAGERVKALRDQLAAKREERATALAKREASAKARALHEQARRFDEDAATLKAEADRLTAAINALDTFRRQLAKGLPIPGLEVEDKQIRVNGVPYEQLNTAQKVDIAVQVAVLRAKGSRLPVVFVDGAEALDTEHFEELVGRLKDSGVQAFLGRVDDTPFQVVRS